MQIVESLFLLGGHDLEMLTIRNVLDAHGYTYVDHQLQWNNAKLSSYQGIEPLTIHIQCKASNKTAQKIRNGQ